MRAEKTRTVVAGIFVGGASKRMGGRPKGLLVAPSGETIVARWMRMFGALEVPCVLVGRQAAYDELGIETLTDDPPGIGPLGGLISLFSRAGAGSAIAVGCDMPFVSQKLLERLVEFSMGAPAVAARRTDVWEPLFARYEAPPALAAARAAAAAGRHALFGVLDALGAEALPMSPEELDELRDWDEPPLASDP
jgi:molybdopterin-guanine dinucleotide biosynthesis protein A